MSYDDAVASGVISAEAADVPRRCTRSIPPIHLPARRRAARPARRWTLQRPMLRSGVSASRFHAVACQTRGHAPRGGDPTRFLPTAANRKRAWKVPTEGAGPRGRAARAITTAKPRNYISRRNARANRKAASPRSPSVGATLPAAAFRRARRGAIGIIPRQYVADRFSGAHAGRIGCRFPASTRSWGTAVWATPTSRPRF